MKLPPPLPPHGSRSAISVAASFVMLNLTVTRTMGYNVNDYI